MLTYYPPIHPYVEHQLKVSDTHNIYVEECGTQEGIPVLFVHGGPGAGCSENDRRFFDPNIYRIVLFDQRGCGRSTPHASLEENNTQKLVSDMEAIREHLGIDKWVLFGGSWGSTLSLVYAQTYPERVLGLILRGIFLNRQQDVDWLFHGAGANYIFPDHWESFLAQVPNTTTAEIIPKYYKLLTGKDDLARMAAAKAWAQWEGQCLTLLPNNDVLSHFDNPHLAMSLARLECHYFLNKCFLSDNQILNNMDKLANISGIIVHGRYDIVCSVDNAWQLHQSWPNSTLHIVRDAGHASLEPGTLDALIHATQTMAKQIIAT